MGVLALVTELPQVNTFHSTCLQRPIQPFPATTQMLYTKFGNPRTLCSSLQSLRSTHTLVNEKGCFTFTYYVWLAYYTLLLPPQKQSLFPLIFVYSDYALHILFSSHLSEQFVVISQNLCFLGSL